MKLKHLPFETKQALNVIKEYIGTKNNSYAITYCIAVTAETLKKKILEEEMAKQQTKKEEANDGQ